MRPLVVFGALLGTLATMPAQNPCSPPASFETLFQGTTYLGTPDPVNGANMLFDLVVDADVSISQIDVNLYDNGNPNPNLIGMTTNLVVWTTPTTWVGNEMNQSAWTQIATGTLTVADFNQHSTAVFTPPFTLPAGTYGVALQHMPVPGQGPVHPIYTNPAVVPTPLTISDQFLSLTAGAGQANAFTSGVAQPRVINTEIHYTPVAGAGYYSEYGAGCYDNPRTFYEDFPVPPAAFDLSNTGLQLIFTGSSYTVTPGTPTLFPPTSASLTLNPPAITGTTAAPWDDALSAPQTLPFTFPYPGGSTNQIVIGSNGYVFLDATASSTAPYYSRVNLLLSDLPRHCPFWGDIDPSAGGTVHYDVDPSNQIVYVTWMNVPEWNVPTALSTFQIALHSSGIVEYRYGTCSISAAPALVGWSPGGNATDPGSIDISASLPFVTGDGSVPPVLTADARPVLGTAPNLVTSDIRAGSTAGFLFLGFTPVFPGLDLAAFGMPGCSQFIQPVVTNFFPVAGTSHSAPLSIPNSSALTGTQAVGQSAILTPGLNTAGIVVSNGLCLTVGNL